MEGLARAGMGEPFIITNASQAAGASQRFRKMIESPVLTSVKARFEGIDVYDVEPQQLPDVLGEPARSWCSASGAASPGGQLVVEGQSASGPYRNSGADRHAREPGHRRAALPVGAPPHRHRCPTRSRWKAARACAAASPSWACATTC